MIQCDYFLHSGVAASAETSITTRWKKKKITQK